MEAPARCRALHRLPLRGNDLTFKGNAGAESFVFIMEKRIRTSPAPSPSLPVPSRSDAEVLPSSRPGKKHLEGIGFILQEAKGTRAPSSPRAGNRAPGPAPGRALPPFSTCLISAYLQNAAFI